MDFPLLTTELLALVAKHKVLFYIEVSPYPHPFYEMNGVELEGVKLLDW